MAIQIVPHAPQFKAAVDAFNHRMRAGGSQYGFYVDAEPTWIPKRSETQPVYREFYLAVEDDAVRGGYALKPQAWWIRGALHTVADWQGPFSEGAISNHYGALGLRMLRDMLKKQPLLYSWGHGGEDQAIMQLLSKLQWRLHPTPFLVRIVRPAHFARKNAYLRQDPKKRAALDALAFTGLASLGGRALHAALRAKSLRIFRSEAEKVPEFGAWADALWEQARDEYSALAVRDAAAMNTLIPKDERQYEWSELHRLRVRAPSGDDLGWAVVTVRTMEGHHRYGTTRVGAVVDSFARPTDAGSVIHAAFDWLRHQGAELVIANQSDPRWARAYQDNGFLALQGKRMFCAAPPLVAALEPFDEAAHRLFLTNMDGHGPMGL
jgi:hypothetical protein